MDSFKSLGFQGSVERNEQAAWMASVLTSFQRRHNVFGAVAEIGVHHGFYFLSIALTARVGEPLLALDLFADQHKNVDGSGNGDQGIFRSNLQLAGFPAEAIKTLQGASTDVSADTFCSALGPSMGIRFFSIDGGHTKEIVMNDLVFAEHALVEGGIVAADDYSNLYWPGVVDGVGAYFERNAATTRLAPFLLHNNKLYITTKSHHDLYLEAVHSMSFWNAACIHTDTETGEHRQSCYEGAGPGETGQANNRFRIGGAAVGIAEFRKFDVEKAKALWKEAWPQC
ncbi:hypothetical protein HYH03_015050 [Edaphochlamys debaryana]|uniref:Class I SAM-dependent methyltransferase n=1 Tax=Edaphochlamys debaryana TaxID=47281 RepID=A0A835XML7_9CHLO|nr:hypothetical protein HYH03_015050 [Edaphochlamys debaryana]|eukprot:KAG2486225.1 hypothetical protein HYH03_015050 [Edaphochlamys debaryana]